MKTHLDCIPCFFKQVLEAARSAGAGENEQKELADKMAVLLPGISMSSSPPETGRLIYGMVHDHLNEKDIYSEKKHKCNIMALSLYDRLKKKVAEAEDPILRAIELAIAGNIIDYGLKNSDDITRELDKLLKDEDKKIRKSDSIFFEYGKFRDKLKDAVNILYLLDNAGEIVFDRVFIEEIKSIYPDKKIICAVKEKPIINDALTEDAYFCGLDKTAEIISSGSDLPGTIPSMCFESFQRIYNSADMVISKGQGNFETLSDTPRPVFFLFMAKCPVVAREMKCSLGDIILQYNA
ncbi:MAG: ARMT1-like domain-containing protein [Candidatus Omnitrophota bacterium]